MTIDKKKPEDNFNFFVPFDLEKAKADGEWRIRGIASTDHMDLQGEIVRQNSLDISPLLDGKGLFNWDHMSGPENIVGKIDKADIKQDGLHVEGYLFKNSERAKGVYGILSSLKKDDKRRFGFSIEGKVLRRAGVDGREIVGARVEKVAITDAPVNPYTYTELIKSLNSDSQFLDSTQQDKKESVDTYTKQEVFEIVQQSIKKTFESIKKAKNQAIVKKDFDSCKGMIQDHIKKYNEVRDTYRKAKVLTKYFYKSDIGLLQRKDGSPTDYALIAKAWNEDIPTTINEAKELGIRSFNILQKSTSLLKSYNIYNIASQSIDFISRLAEVNDYAYIVPIGQALKASLLADNTDQIAVNLKRLQNYIETVGIHLVSESAAEIYDRICEALDGDGFSKALSAGSYNTAPSNLSDGSALQTEDLEEDNKKKKKKLSDSTKK
ncbi:MAG TPA: hypothetical protein PLJ37_00560 [Chitinophagales bacterium]|nr:hypothetical protein [Chitinophagales bacterium]HMW93444.1 hypothetical protein [Chitinophagales bacterium]HMZ92933.1 hypothetical protein [Chitinophagales bacterium]HNG25877.1 hypothetical protein [Chitinophagales bacterium]